MTFGEFLAWLTPWKLITDWRHEKTMREQNKLQADIERQKMAVEIHRIECLDIQHARQIEFEREKLRVEAAKFLLEKGCLPEPAARKVLGFHDESQPPGGT
jgi:hypothetical protein